MSRYEIDALKEIANQDITRLFDALRIDYDDRYQYITAPCPIHKGEREDAFSYHIDYGTYKCFSRGCEQKYGKDCFGLVMGILKCGFPKAKKFVEDLYFKGNVNIKEVIELKKTRDFVRKSKIEEDRIFPDETLTRLEYHNYLESRGYPRELLESYQAGVPKNSYGRMSNRIIFPVRNIDGQIVGFTGRTLYEDWKERKIGKWEHSTGFKKKRHLFNIDRAAPYIKKTGQAILVEGPLDVLRLEQAGIHNGVAIFGRSLEDKQMILLLSCNATKIIVALDADNAGKTGSEQAKQKAQNFFDVKIIELRNGDVGDLSSNECKTIFSQAIA